MELGEDAVYEPKRIQVFGIVHTVFGGMGLLNTLMALVMLPLMGPMFEVLKKAVPPEEADVFDLQMKFMADISPISWVSTILGAILAVAIFVAGLGLIKRKKAGLKWSNRWAIMSLLGKVISIGLFLMMVEKIMDLYRGMLADIPDTENMLAILKAVIVVFGVTVPLLMAIYPIIALKMLNNDAVRHWLK